MGAQRPRVGSWLILPLTVLAILLRLNVAFNADLGPDEPIYVDAGRVYVHLLRTGDFSNPSWYQNVQQPVVPKVILGLSADLGVKYFALDPIVAARLSAVGAGVLTILALFFLGRPIFGTGVSLLAAAVLALNPWDVYWSGLAMLDPFLVLFLALAFLILLKSRRAPLWALVAAGCFGLAFSSKYTAAFAVPALVVVGLQSLGIRKKRTWLLSTACAAIAGLVTVLINLPTGFFRWPRIVIGVWWELDLARLGHPAYYAGQLMTHTPWWIPGYVVLAKNSLVVLALALVPLISLVARRDRRPTTWIASLWLWGMLAPFSLLTIVVADHYLLPLAVPLAVCAALGATTLANLLVAKLHAPRVPVHVALVGILLLPLVIGLGQFSEVEGYTNELMRPQSQFIPVATTGYRGALDWIAQEKPGATVAFPYFAEGSEWVIRRDRLPLDQVSIGQSGPDFIIVPAFAFQDELVPRGTLAGYHLAFHAGESGLTYAYVYSR